MTGTGTPPLDLRALVRQVCQGCGFWWQAPVKGKCPQCHGDEVTVLEVTRTEAKHV